MPVNVSHELQDFLAFIFKDDVVSLGVGIILGGAFSNTVNSFVNDLLTPVLDLVSTKSIDSAFYVLRPGPKGPYKDADAAVKDGAVIVRYGAFLQTIINLFVQGFCLFLIIRGINAAKKLTDQISMPKMEL